MQDIERDVKHIVTQQVCEVPGIKGISETRGQYLLIKVKKVLLPHFDFTGREFSFSKQLGLENYVTPNCLMVFKIGRVVVM